MKNNTNRRSKSSDIPRSVLAAIDKERQRQIAKGFTPEHDDQHTDGQLIEAAVAHIQASELGTRQIWPFAEQFKPATTRKEAVTIGAALLVAELERISRSEGGN